MSDSPYSMRTVGEALHEQGAHVIGLRLPGHGTAPSGLVTFGWEDMAAAVRLAMEHLSRNVGNKPLYLVGYSNGGALSVHYVLDSLQDESLPRVNGVVLLSPAIGVSPMAAFAVWQARAGHWLGLEKLAATLKSGERDFTVTILSNRRETVTPAAVEVRAFPPAATAPTISDPGLAWPDGLYSLSHIAVPFRADDRIYGNQAFPDEGSPANRSPTYQIGNVHLRGERDILAISATDQLRLRWNPF